MTRLRALDRPEGDLRLFKRRARAYRVICRPRWAPAFAGPQKGQWCPALGRPGLSRAQCLPRSLAAASCLLSGVRAEQPSATRQKDISEAKVIHWHQLPGSAVLHRGHTSKQPACSLARTTLSSEGQGWFI